mmetsp:Transcript_10644/g.36125  ORF Transcript_10644/g.36125 Transcript_10644/m.36125 type:complete len:304 (-) Transcript_10644:2503-3414(-)
MPRNRMLARPDTPGGPGHGRVLLLNRAHVPMAGGEPRVQGCTGRPPCPQRRQPTMRHGAGGEAGRGLTGQRGVGDAQLGTSRSRSATPRRRKGHPTPGRGAAARLQPRAAGNRCDMHARGVHLCTTPRPPEPRARLRTTRRATRGMRQPTSMTWSFFFSARRSAFQAAMRSLSSSLGTSMSSVSVARLKGSVLSLSRCRRMAARSTTDWDEGSVTGSRMSSAVIRHRNSSGTSPRSSSISACSCSASRRRLMRALKASRLVSLSMRCSTLSTARSKSAASKDRWSATTAATKSPPLALPARWR